jgi:hypothetical protein
MKAVHVQWPIPGAKSFVFRSTVIATTRLSTLRRLIGKVAPSTLREKEVGEFCTETKGPGQFSWLVLPIVTAL